MPNPTLLRQEILQLGQHFGARLVEVDVLSRQAGDGIVGLPTPEGLWTRLRYTPLPYDILIYLGHGDRAQHRDDLLPLGLLYLETLDGEEGYPVTADVLAGELHNNPVPVVLLVGCFTAAELPADQRDGILAAMPRAMRGNQGVAQALVNSSSGVQLAVGMRYKLESDDAWYFLSAFFKSLLQDKPGNVEAAVHAGREKLHAVSPYHASWSAPMLFRVLRDEPMFDFLASPPAIIIDQKDQAFRAKFWEWLKSQSLSKGLPEPITSLTNGLRGIEQELVQNMLAKAPLLMPEWWLGPQEQKVQLPIHLYGLLDIDELEGKLIVDGDGINIEGIVGTPELKNGGYRVLPDIEGNQAFFRIQRRQAKDGPLPQGPLMNATLQLGPTTGVIYPVSLSALESYPQRTICPGNSVIIVPAP